jgi:hypothetical protein
MRKHVKQSGRLATVLGIGVAFAVGLTACGSDNDNASAPPPAAGGPAPGEGGNFVPASAGVSVAAYIAYVRGLKTDETSSPVNIGGFVAPVDDAASPTVLGG